MKSNPSSIPQEEWIVGWKWLAVLAPFLISIMLILSVPVSLSIAWLRPLVLIGIRRRPNNGVERQTPPA